MNSVNQTSPTNLSTLYPDLPQTVQLEHFADLLQKLFHAIDVIILVQTDHGCCFVSSVSSVETDVVSLLEQFPLAFSSNGSDAQEVQTTLVIRNFLHGNNLAGKVFLKQQFQIVSEEQDAALLWMIDCIVNYLSTEPIPEFGLELRVFKSVDLSKLLGSSFHASDSVTQWFCSNSMQHTSLSNDEFCDLIGEELSAWIMFQFESNFDHAKIRVQQSSLTTISVQILWWRVAHGGWFLQVQDLSLANQLRQSQQQLAFLQSLFTSGIAAMVGINAKHQVVYANAQARQMLQISQFNDRLRAPLDIGYLQFFDPDQMQLGAIPVFGEIGSDWSTLNEQRRLVQYPGGDERVLSLWVAPHNDLQSPDIVAYCLLMDMTEQYQLQRALQEMQEHIDSLLHFSPAAIYQSFTNLSHGFMYISPNIEKITGFTQTEVMDDPGFWPRHVHPDDLALVLSEHTNDDNSLEYRLFSLRKQRYVWVKDIRNSSPEEGDEHIVFGALLDIDAQKEAELEQVRLQVELDNQKIELSQSLDSMVDAVITINEYGTILSCNPATCSLFDFSLTELKSMQFVELLVTPLSFNRYFAELTSSREFISEQKAIEFSGKTKSGKTIYFSCTMAELPANTSLKRRFVACLHDLTEFKLQQEQLIQAGKLSALGTLTSGIAHDFNNILGIIRGYAEMLSLRSETQVASYATNIIKAADRGAAMTKNLLDFSSNKSRDIIKTDINQLINDMLDMLSEAVTKRITLQINLTSESLPTEMEKGGLENALLNLVINARHAIKDLGTISLSSERIVLTQGMAASLDLTAGSYCCVRVKDTGSGMSDEVQQRLFEPFFTTKGTQGTGLGLAQVFGFCRRCKGTVRVNSTEGIGTEFVLYFPYIESKQPVILTESPKPAQQSRFSANKPAKTTSKILIVDDEEELLAVNSMLLESAGYQVVSANSMAVAIAELQSQQFNLLLSDIVMPNGTGLQLAAYVQQHYPELPVQLISGFADESMIEEESCRQFYEARLQKPLKTSILLNKVAELLQLNSVNKDNSHVSI